MPDEELLPDAGAWRLLQGGLCISGSLGVLALGLGAYLWGNQTVTANQMVGLQNDVELALQATEEVSRDCSETSRALRQLLEARSAATARPMTLPPLPPPPTIVEGLGYRH